MRRGRVPALVGFGGLVALLAMAGPAWACLNTVSPQLGMLQPSQAQPGAQVVAGGEHWSTGSPVELHWQSAAGAPLGAATPDATGAFSQPIVVPSGAAPTTYYVVAVQGQAVAPSVLQVVAPGAVPAPANGSGTQPGRPGGASPAAVSGGVPSSASVTGSQPAGAAPQMAATSPASTALPQGAAPVAGTQPRAASGGRLSASAPSTTPRPLTRQGIGDLWSGFAHGGTPAPGLLNVPPSSPVSVPTVEVVGVLAALAAMGGGFGIAELRRAKATVKAGR